MKIGIYDPYMDDLGGGEKYIMQIAKCLSEKHKVSIFWDSKEDLQNLEKRFLIDLSGIEIVENIFSQNLYKRLNESRKYDIIISLSDGSIPFLFSKETFLHIQQPLPIRKFDVGTQIKLKRISNIFCNSYYTKSYIDKLFGIKSAVLYPPITLKPKKIKKENIILNVGRFRVRDIVTKKGGAKKGIGDYKKQSFMSEVFKELIKQDLKDWEMVVAVSVKDDEVKEFEAFKKNCEGFPIRFLINKNNNELWDIYSRAKIYWHATGFGENLRSHPELAEHFGISTVEAMGAGVVPVVINAGGQKEIVRNNVDGFLWDTKQDLREKTLMLINEEKLWLKMSKSSMKRAEHFAGDRFCKELSGILSP